MATPRSIKYHKAAKEKIEDHNAILAVMVSNVLNIRMIHYGES